MFSSGFSAVYGRHLTQSLQQNVPYRQIAYWSLVSGLYAFLGAWQSGFSIGWRGLR